MESVLTSCIKCFMKNFRQIKIDIKKAKKMLHKIMVFSGLGPCLVGVEACKI